MLRMERERGDLEQRTHGLLVDKGRLEEQCDHLCRQLQEAKVNAHTYKHDQIKYWIHSCTV